MRVERDMAGIALFFIAGTASGTFLFPDAASFPETLSHARLAASASSILMVPLGIAVLRHTSRKDIPAVERACLASDRKESLTYTALTLLLFYLSGLSGALASAISSDIGIMECSGAAASAGRLIETCSRHFRDAIDAVPYGDPGCNALAKALLSGDKSAVSPEIEEAFRRSGASHILALSGMHLGVIYAILLKATAFAGNSPAAKKIRSVTIVFISGCYTLVTGASASLVRAMLFISINEAARIAGRQPSPMNTFFASALIQLAVTPGSIRSAGFQLSYLAVAGIHLLYPAMRKWYPGNGRGDILKKIWDSAALSIACQVFTGPAAWIIFGTFPKYFLITNLLAVPLSTFLMILSAAATILYPAGLCPEILLRACSKSSELLSETLRLIAGLP